MWAAPLAGPPGAALRRPGAGLKPTAGKRPVVQRVAEAWGFAVGKRGGGWEAQVGLGEGVRTLRDTPLGA